MYYPFFNNPFYYPSRAYMNNMCSSNHIHENYLNEAINNYRNSYEINQNNNINTNEQLKNNMFSITDDRVELFGISINIDDLIILITLFFMFKENQIDYSIVIILAIILFDQK